jgi:ADP-ribosyl-[dinitrogen reductase] hydrolase
MNAYLDKFGGTLFGVAIGDTLGKPFEGWLRDQIRSEVSEIEDLLHSRKFELSTFTDDTQLTLHTAEALISSSGFNIHDTIREYIKWLDDPPIGPGMGCLSAIQKLKHGFSSREAASDSGGNGTAMRISPIGLLYCNDIKGLINAAQQCSLLTHTHPGATVSAIVIARAIAFLVNIDQCDAFPTHDFFQALKDAISGSKFKEWDEMISILDKVYQNLGSSLYSGLIKFSQIGVKSPYFIEEYLGKAFVHPYAISTVACSLFIFLKNLESFEQCIFELSTAGGDSDTVGAIGGSLAGAYFGLKLIPPRLIDIIKEKKKIEDTSIRLHSTFERINNILL